MGGSLLRDAIDVTLLRGAERVTKGRIHVPTVRGGGSLTTGFGLQQLRGGSGPWGDAYGFVRGMSRRDIRTRIAWDVIEAVISGPIQFPETGPDVLPQGPEWGVAGSCPFNPPGTIVTTGSSQYCGPWSHDDFAPLIRGAGWTSWFPSSFFPGWEFRNGTCDTFSDVELEPTPYRHKERWLSQQYRQVGTEDLYQPDLTTPHDSSHDPSTTVRYGYTYVWEGWLDWGWGGAPTERGHDSAEDNAGEPPQPPNPKPPRPGTKERKGVLTVSGTVAGDILNLVTESLDLLECLHKALPHEFRAKPRWMPGRHGPGWGNRELRGEWVQANPADQFRAVWDNLHRVDLDKFMKCVVQNQLQDMLWGKAGELTKRANQLSDKFAGFEFGPAL